MIDWIVKIPPIELFTGLAIIAVSLIYIVVKLIVEEKALQKLKAVEDELSAKLLQRISELELTHQTLQEYNNALQVEIAVLQNGLNEVSSRLHLLISVCHVKDKRDCPLGKVLQKDT